MPQGAVEDLKAAGLLVAVKPIKHMVPRVSRTGEIVEPMLSEQWYMAMSKPAPEGSLYPASQSLKWDLMRLNPAK